MGEITDDDLNMVRLLVLTPDVMKRLEMHTEEWRNAYLVTPGHRTTTLERNRFEAMVCE
jgi:hypothetical protein